MVRRHRRPARGLAHRRGRGQDGTPGSARWAWTRTTDAGSTLRRGTARDRARRATARTAAMSPRRGRWPARRGRHAPQRSRRRWSRPREPGIRRPATRRPDPTDRGSRRRGRAQDGRPPRPHGQSAGAPDQRDQHRSRGQRPAPDRPATPSRPPPLLGCRPRRRHRRRPGRGDGQRCGRRQHGLHLGQGHRRDGLEGRGLLAQDAGTERRGGRGPGAGGAQAGHGSPRRDVPFLPPPA